MTLTAVSPVFCVLPSQLPLCSQLAQPELIPQACRTRMWGRVGVGPTSRTLAHSCSLPADLDGGLLLVLFTTKEHMCGAGKEDDRARGSRLESFVVSI